MEIDDIEAASSLTLSWLRYEVLAGLERRVLSSLVALGPVRGTATVGAEMCDGLNMTAYTTSLDASKVLLSLRDRGLADWELDTDGCVVWRATL